ncbi:flagellar hook-associated protein 2 [Fictibacillus phosphorivorans]|uniref:flagellar hook-associated protein 2 n=1 Tax=Fictibacillus phosphorivorans TaxID=1221500 RepID=UPI00203BBF85|nr:flagellar hook-associated protein 2 [Fictibacillus phosphorivorans]MCM3718458.1 flagellar hook-associated protein 2 [Fictibacillus phosphorivorans]MCM3776186.1 flagellar hook-associated protein 2 [Fictibacillus phosphorivorans]
MRIGGLASGMDIDSLVKDLMKAERIPLDKLSQKKTLLEWQRDDYRSMNKLLTDLDKLVFEGITLQGSFNKKAVTSSNPGVVSATANGSAVDTSTKIEVLKTATPALWKGSTPLKSDYTASEDATFSFTVTHGDGTQVQKELKIKAGDSIDKIVSAFNSSELGVTAFYDAVKETFVVTKKDTGSKAEIVVDNPETAAFMNDLGFSVDATNNLEGKTSGQDAAFKINGYETTRSSNTFTLSGVTYTLQQEGTANISVASDTNATVDVIKKFVEKYNETIEAINKKTAETRYRAYQPLTTEQRKDLSDKEAEMWDEKAKSGMLRGDSILSSGLNTMRTVLYSTVNTGNSNFDQLSEIGITTSKNYLDKGKLELDEEKLRKALAEDPEAVMKLFTGNGTEEGIAKKLRTAIDQTVDKIELKAGNSLRTNAQFTLGRELTDVDKRISAFEKRLIDVEDRYWRQFSAMEKAIQRSNQQSMYLMQQFGGGQ